MGCNCGGRPRVTSPITNSAPIITDPALAAADGVKYDVLLAGAKIRTFESLIAAERFARTRGATVRPVPA